MCGRFVLILEPGGFEDDFDLGGLPDSYLPRYNIAPTQPVVVVNDIVTRKADLYRWGLISSWAKDLSIGSKLINARAETLAEKPSFRSALKSRRSLILASGFYEWRSAPTSNNSNAKQPLLIKMRDGKLFTFAGLWEEWKSPDGVTMRTTTIITTNSNALISPFHERMPVILEKVQRTQWLDPGTQVSQALNLLRPYSPEMMLFHPVSSMVNNPAYDNPQCVMPVMD